MARGGSNAIGSAAVILSANADGLVNGLERSEAKVKQFGNNVGKALEVKVGPTAGGAGGLFADLAKGANGALGATLGISVGMVALGKAILNTFETRAIADFNEQLERSAKLTDKLLAAFDKRQESHFKFADAIGPDGPGGASAQWIAEKLKEAEKFKLDIQATLNRAAGDMEKGKAGFWGDFSKQLGLGKHLELREQKLKADFDAAGKALEAQNNLIDRYKSKLLELSNPATNWETDLFGQAQAEAADLGKRVSDLTDRLELQAATFGKSAAQAEVWALKLKGVTDQELSAAQAAANLLDKLEGGGKFRLAPAMLMGSKEAHKFAAENGMMDLRNTEMRKGVQVDWDWEKKRPLQAVPLKGGVQPAADKQNQKLIEEVGLMRNAIERLERAATGIGENIGTF